MTIGDDGYGSTTSDNNPRSGYIAALENPSAMNYWSLLSVPETVMLVSVILNASAAGIIFIFSNTIMPALATLDPDVGVYTMNTINTIIVNPLFIFIFFGGLISIYPTVVVWKDRDNFSTPTRICATAATLVYFFGQALVTVTQNVPRNNALLAVDPKSDSGADYWTNDYLNSWVAWNTARGVFAFIASIFGALSLAFMRKP